MKYFKTQEELLRALLDGEKIASSNWQDDKFMSDVKFIFLYNGFILDNENVNRTIPNDYSHCYVVREQYEIPCYINVYSIVDMPKLCALKNNNHQISIHTDEVYAEGNVKDDRYIKKAIKAKIVYEV